jgi:phosphate transport system substrate-binding protein
MINVLASCFILLISLMCFSGADAEIITASGCSVSMSGYLTGFAREYEKRTGVRVLVRGSGSIAGMEDLKSRRVDFAASCRKKFPADPADIEFIQVAWDAMVFIVHTSNPLENISIDQAMDILSGRTTNWKQLNGKDLPVKIFASEPGQGLSGIEHNVKEMLFNGREAPRLRNKIPLASSGIVEQIIEKTPEGFAVSGFSSARYRSVKMLKLNNVRPSRDNISSNKYPFKRPLFLLVPIDPKPEVRKFVAFALSTDGQKLIGSLGAVSLMDEK